MAPRAAYPLVKVNARGMIRLPKRFRDARTYEVRPREGGGLELIPRFAMDASQTWFWSDRWQAMEREADDDVRAGRVRRFNSADEFFAELEKH